MKEGTYNFRNGELFNMVEHPNERANEIGRIPVYHLQYIKDGKPNIKPKESKHEKTVSDK